MIIALWIRLLVIIAFAVFVGVQQIWWMVALCVVFAGVTGYQLYRTYRQP